MVRQLGLIYRKDKALSKAALGFIQVILDHAGNFDPTLKASRVPVTAKPAPSPDTKEARP